VDALLHDARAHQLVDLHTDGALGHVPHDTSLTVVELVRHALLLRAASLDVDNLAELESGEVGAGLQDTVRAVVAAKQLARASAVSE
jgi:hypothetical protein